MYWVETKEKIVTFWTAWDNVEYAMTYMNIPAEVTANIWNGDDQLILMTGLQQKTGVRYGTCSRRCRIDVTTKGNIL